ANATVRLFCRSPLYAPSPRYGFHDLYSRDVVSRSFPTRRSSDLIVVCTTGPLLFLNQGDGKFRLKPGAFHFANPPQGTFTGAAIDRKSTRLNSSHGSISYAVFCLKKKNI